MRKLFVVVLFIIIILAVPYNPTNPTSSSEAQHDITPYPEHFGTAPPIEEFVPYDPFLKDLNETGYFNQQFIYATDGNQSSDSITSFSKTTDDDVLSYPDAFPSDPILADGGNVTAINESSEEEINDYTDTHTSNDVDRVYTVTSLGTVISMQQLNFNISQYSSYTIEKIGWNIEGYGAKQTGGVDEWHDIELWDFTNEEWDDVDDYYFASSVDTWHNETIIASDYHNSTDVLIRINSTLTYDTACILSSFVDYADIVIYYMTLSDADHYAEGFSDVSDFTLHIGDKVATSDGDVGSFYTKGDNNWDYYKTNSPSVVGADYIGFSIKGNDTTNTPIAYIKLFSEDGQAGDIWNSGNIYPILAFTPYKFYVGQDVESMYIMVRHTSVDFKVSFDDMRIGPADEFGWSHDGSTTEGWALAYGDGSVSSDGDNVNFTGVYDIMFDAGTTDQYPFCEVSISALSGYWLLGVWIDAGLHTIQSTLYDTGTFRYNIRSEGSGRITGFRFYSYASGSVVVDYIQAYGIANWTVSQPANAETTDVYYVNSGSLVRETVRDYIWMTLHYDPSLSIAQSTYPVWNLSVSGFDDALNYGFRQYNGAWQSWDYDTSRGAIYASTLTDIQITTYTEGSISSLKFIEDGTAPDADVIATPTNPYDDESVTLSSIVFDTVEVWKVWFNAISYPDGFSDQDYEATEGQENYWSYTFAAGILIAGDYCFKVIANDGANNNTISESNRDYATVRFTVREAEINLEPINQEGAEPDATHYQVSFESNKAGTWGVTEWIQSDGSDAAETHTGVVVQGWNNIAWEKLDTSSTLVYFNMTVTNGTLTKTVPGLYLIAQTTFYIQRITPVSNSETVTVSGRISKLASYTVYDEDNFVQTTGSLSSLDFKITFDQWRKHTGEMVYYKITFSNGTQTTSFESEYEAVKPLAEYEGRAVGEPTDAKTSRQTIEFWSFLSAFLVCVFMVLFLIDKFRGAK